VEISQIIKHGVQVCHKRTKQLHFVVILIRVDYNIVFIYFTVIVIGF